MNLEYYAGLSYPIRLTAIVEEDGGGWLAEIPLLKGCMSDGETPAEALQNLDEAKQEWLSTALKRGNTIPIPIPNSSDEGEYSGKFTMRLPKKLHRSLALMAKEENMSLNQYILALISFNFGFATATKKCSADSPVEYHNHNNYNITIRPNKNYGEVSEFEEVCNEMEDAWDLEANSNRLISEGSRW